MAERVGFEPTETFASTVFKTAAFDHSATSPGENCCAMGQWDWARGDRGAIVPIIVPELNYEIDEFACSPGYMSHFAQGTYTTADGHRHCG